MSEPEQCGCRPPIECPYQYLQPTKTALWGEQWRDYALGLEADLADAKAKADRLERGVQTIKENLTIVRCSPNMDPLINRTAETCYMATLKALEAGE